MSDSYNPCNWYWIIGGSTTQVYSSSRKAFVPQNDEIYLAWVARGNRAQAAIQTNAELWDLLATACPDGLPADAGAQDVKNETQYNQIPVIVRKIIYDFDKRVRALEGQPERTANQFKQYVKGL